MADNIENLIIEHLKAMRSEIAEIKADTTDIKQRLRSVDTSILELRRNDVHIYEDAARQQVTLDKIIERIQRLERRLELS